MKLILMSIAVALLHTEILGTEADVTCTAIQYVELGMSGMVNCKFNEGYFGVFWYNSTEYTNAIPFIYLQNSEKGGRGYTSGEFDIYPNGSLIIKNTTLQHDHSFTVIMFETSTHAPSPIFIQVVVYVKPAQVYPQIDSCGNERICVNQVRRKLDLRCRVTDARPAAQLVWLVRTLPSDLNVTLETVLLEESPSLTTVVKTRYNFQSLNRFALLICKETSSHRVLKEAESWILLENSLHNISNINSAIEYIKINSKMELLCSDSSMLYLAWGKIKSNGSFSNLAYSVPSEKWNRKIHSTAYHLGTKGSLIAFEVGFQHEGIYACLYGDGTSEDQRVYEIFVYDDIPVTPSEGTFVTKRSVGLPGIIVIVLVVLFLIAVFGLLICFKVHYHAENVQSQNQYHNDEDQPMVQTMTIGTGNSISKKTLLKQQLQQIYKRHCESFLPVPFLQNSKHKLHHLFVDSGIEDLIVTSEAKADLPGPLSYLDILKLCSSKKQILVVGEPGYGKTMLSYRLAYDWCCETDGDIDIFILLKMRNLGGIKSLPSAIKKFLLPHDSRLTEGDIDSILGEASSVVIVLDSFDKYPDASSYGDTFVKLIMTKQILLNSTVILTTRPSSLPPAVLSTAKGIKLTGFTKDSQKKYIQNVLTEKRPSHKTVDEIFHKNAILEAICQVPLFFTLLVHISFEDSQSDRHNYLSMTSFFRDVTKYFNCCINQEFQNISPHNGSTFEEQHFMLGKMAFEGLSKDHRKIFWSRQEFRQHLGDEFYNHCLNVGLFYEEDIKTNNSVTSPEECQKFTSWVRFYHNIFCEWFAAFHLARLAEKLSSNELKQLLKSIDPINLQYVYRFACGLNEVAAEKIIDYLESFKDGQKFAILCLLEQQQMSTSTVENLCKSPFNISFHDGRLFHVSMLELLKVASTRKIPCKEVWLTNMEGSVKDSKRIVFKSDLELEIIDTLSQLSIVDVGRQFPADDFLGIFKYATLCSQLSVLRFRTCILPRHVEIRDFVERKITVEWNPFQDHVWFTLNLISGNWEHQGEELKEEQYSQIVENVGHVLRKRLSTCFETQKSSTISEELADFLGIKSTDSREEIKEIVRKHCLSPINIHDTQRAKAQTSFIELLTFASECKIHIEGVWLVGLYSTFENSGLKFCSGFILPELQTLRQMTLVDTGRKFSEKNLLGILQYSWMCPTLNTLRLLDCLLPEKISLEEIGVDQHDKDIIVKWSFTSVIQFVCFLNFETGSWQHENEEISKEKYQEIEKSFTKLPGTTAS